MEAFLFARFDLLSDGADGLESAGAAFPCFLPLQGWRVLRGAEGHLFESLQDLAPERRRVFDGEFAVGITQDTIGGWKSCFVVFENQAVGGDK